METVYIGLGSNLQHPPTQIAIAREKLKQLKCSRFVATSWDYHSDAMLLPNMQPQPRYLNSVVQLETGLLPQELLYELHLLEDQQERKRTELWGSRTLDLDILLYGDQIIMTDKLRIPHPELAKRNFVIYPLYELNPELLIPGLGSIRELRERCSREGIERSKLPPE